MNTGFCDNCFTWRMEYSTYYVLPHGLLPLWNFHTSFALNSLHIMQNCYRICCSTLLYIGIILLLIHLLQFIVLLSSLFSYMKYTLHVDAASEVAKNQNRISWFCLNKDTALFELWMEYVFISQVQKWSPDFFPYQQASPMLNYL